VGLRAPSGLPPLYSNEVELTQSRATDDRLWRIGESQHGDHQFGHYWVGNNMMTAWWDLATANGNGHLATGPTDATPNLKWPSPVEGRIQPPNHPLISI